MDKVIGKIKNYVFHNEENSYSIARLITLDEKIVTIVGYFPKISEDVIYEFMGTWVKHQTYGEQLKVESFKKTEKQSANGLISYLSSSFFTGIGPKTAEKMVEAFGLDVIQKVIDKPQILKEIGLKKIRIVKFHQQLIENQTNEHILVRLYSYNLSGRLAMKLLNKYQSLTIDKLEENPYRLIDDIDGIGFIKADEIAHKLGIKADDIRRIKAALLYALEHIAYQNGDLYLTLEQLTRETIGVLQTDIALDDGIKTLLEENRIIIEDNRYYLTMSYFTETKLAEKISKLNDKSDFNVDKDYVNTLIDRIEMTKDMDYTDVQKEAILS